MSSKVYQDGRPSAKYRLNALDQGRVLHHGAGPADCDQHGAREAIIFKNDDSYYMHYDGAGPDGWLACLAESSDLVHWKHHGPVLGFGEEGRPDSASASSPWVYVEDDCWHMFYLGTPNASEAPDRVPQFPYLTMKAKSDSPNGPWQKQYDVVPLQVEDGTYYSATASPGHIVYHEGEYLMFFSASTPLPSCQRTIGIARSKDLDGIWTPDPEPIVPLSEQIENSSLYYDESSKTWWLFTNHIGIKDGVEYTDAVWAYWTNDLNEWDPEHKAVVLDGENCKWSKECFGMPSVLEVDSRLAMLYDAPGDSSLSHMNRDIGLAWLELPLKPTL